MTQHLAITASGMVCGVGLSAPAACAAIRCALDNFRETDFKDAGGERIAGSPVPMKEQWTGITKQVKMLSKALAECVTGDPGIRLEQVPLLLCLAEEDRPGRLEDLDRKVFNETQQELGVTFHPRSTVIPKGRVGFALAIRDARTLIRDERLPGVIIAGVDSFLYAATVTEYEKRDRLLTDDNSDGFIPGEAAAAVLVQPPRQGQDALVCAGIGFGREKATVESEDIPLRADGLVAAIKGAVAEAGCDLGVTDFRITDLSGEQYYFKEASIALSRTLRQLKEEYDIWHPADCIGEVGAAIGPAMMTVLLAAMRKGYSPGRNVLAHMGSDDGARAAMILKYQERGTG